MDLHERLVAARKHAGHGTATEAAEALGVAYPTYAGHENGSSGFRHKTAVFYARRFGVSLEWLLTGRGAMTNASQDPDLAELIQLLRDAEPEVKDAVSLLLKSRKPSTSPELSGASRRRQPSNRR